MAMVLDAVVGALVGELMSAIIEMKNRAVKFKPTLERLETTLKSIGPLINQIDELNKKLDRPAEEIEKLINHMKIGKDLVLKCSDKLHWWNCCYKSQYQEKIQELDEQIRRFFELDMRAQDTRNGLETLAEIREVHAILRNERLVLRDVSSSVLLKPFRPFSEKELKRNLKRNLKKIEHATAALAAAEDWLLVFAPTTRNIGLPPTSSFSNSIPFQTKLSSSANKFNSMVQVFFEDVEPLDYWTLAFAPTTTTSFNTNLTSFQPKLSSSAHKFNSMVQDLFQNLGRLEVVQLEDLALEGLYKLFSFYVNLLINALPVSAADENLNGSELKIVKIAETEGQQLALLSNAVLLADDLLLRAVAKLSHSTKGDDSVRRGSEQRELKERLQREVYRLRDSFCRQHILELILTEDGEALLNAQTYLCLDEPGKRPGSFPSPIFQELFIKLTRVAGIASDLFVGRERFATILLTRLAETVVLWLSGDQAFWEEIETGPTPLGPLGLQQLCLDMKFVMLFSSQGRYLSHRLHQAIKNIIDRAIDVVAATGIDPISVLPEDDLFVEVSEITIKMITKTKQPFIM